MYNDRDHKYEGSEESEYHFSDEEVSYEVDTESVKPAPTGPQKESVLSGLTRSKRMLISLGVFVVLVFIVYKMVSPSTPTTPSTDITAPVTNADQGKVPKMAPSVPAAVTPPAVMSVNTTPNNLPSQQPNAAVNQTQAQPNMAQAAPSQPAMANPSPDVTVPAGFQPNQSAMPAAQPSVPAQPLAAQQPNAQPTIAAQQPAANVAPTVIPAPPPAPYAAGQQQALPSVMDNRVPGGVNANINNMTAESDKLVSQLQTEYAQKVNDYATQNKALQDQVQTLNTRMASMETELNQLVQALIRQNTAANNAPQANPAAAAPQAPEPRVAYNVQAIIPGRAWLRSDSGETVTVTEGDMIKELGRVTKIDPYDGVVEVNTGTRTISLSYGNGG